MLKALHCEVAVEMVMATVMTSVSILLQQTGYSMLLCYKLKHDTEARLAGCYLQHQGHANLFSRLDLGIGAPS